MFDFSLNIAFAFVSSVAILKFFEDRFCLACLANGKQIISIILGATIVAMFTELLNGIYSGVHETNSIFVLILPLAFIAFMLIHQHIYRHGDDRAKSAELNMTVKTVASISDVLIGILAVTQIQKDIFSEFIFLGILLSYELIEQLSLHIVHEESGTMKKPNLPAKIFFSILPLAGFFYAYFIGVSKSASVILLALYGGTLFSLMIREILSQERKIAYSYFLAGAGALTVLFLINLYFLTLFP